MPNYVLNIVPASIVGGTQYESSGYIPPGGYTGAGDYYVGVDSIGHTGIANSGIVNYSPGTISLNGAAFIPLASLPAGFNPTPATGVFNPLGGTTAGGIGALMQRVGIAPNTLFAQMIVQYGTIFGPTTYQLNGQTGATTTTIAPSVAPTLNVIDLYLSLSCQLFLNDMAKFTSLVFHDLQFVDAYQIITNSWTLTDLTHPSLYPSTMLVGDVAQIASPNNDLGTITTIIVGSTVINPPFVVQTPSIIQFNIPPPTIPNPTPISVTGTQFTGSVLVGTANIIVANATGVYNLTPGKLTDTIYISSATSNLTVDVPRPNPFFKTGYIGG